MTDPYIVTPQTPLLSGFGPRSTPKEILRGCDLKGNVAIVTGGHSGLGLETTRALAEYGCNVIVVARSALKARDTLAKIPGLEAAELDLIDPASIDTFGRQFLRSGKALHILVNNAGIMAAPLTRDARGYESQFATNHLGHFQLTLALWPALVKSGRARVVSLSSTGVRFGGIDFDDPNFEKRPYEKWKAYGQSKSANALFAVALDRRGYQDGVRAFSVHPGRVATELGRFLSPAELAVGGEFKTPEQGAATSVWCATSGQLTGKGGVYCMDCDIAPRIEEFSLQGTGQVVNGVLPWAIDPVAAEKLWSLSEHMTGVRFPY